MGCCHAGSSPRCKLPGDIQAEYQILIQLWISSFTIRHLRCSNDLEFKCSLQVNVPAENRNQWVFIMSATAETKKIAQRILKDVKGLQELPKLINIFKV